MADRTRAMENLERALGELESYAAIPVVNRRDKAGLIQAFEFTFELFWKLSQKLAPDAGLEAASPREAWMGIGTSRAYPEVADLYPGRPFSV